MKIKYFLIAGLCLSLFGCASYSTKNAVPFADPQYGMTKRQLIETYGLPVSVEIYQKSDKTRIEFDTYVKYYQSTQGMVKVPVALIDNKVVGWGTTFYQDHISMDDTRIK